MIYKRGDVYHAKFKFRNCVYQRSLRTKDEATAKILHDRMRESVRASATAAETLIEETRQIASDWADVTPVKLGRVVDQIFAGLRSRSGKRGLESTITKADIEALIHDCAGYCAVTGIPLSFSAKLPGARVSPWMPSLDRIDCRKGYTKTNCRIVCYLANISMSQFGEGALKLMLAYYGQNPHRKRMPRSS